MSEREAWDLVLGLRDKSMNLGRVQSRVEMAGLEGDDTVKDAMNARSREIGLLVAKIIDGLTGVEQ